MKRWHILNDLIRRKNIKSYLEIGYDKGENYKKIDCEIKFAVDPNVHKEEVFSITSDDYFDLKPNRVGLIFIDGLHTYDQVKKDVLNSLETSDYIAIHDIAPTKTASINPVRDKKEWCGDVWKMASILLSMNKPETEVYTHDYGILVIKSERFSFDQVAFAKPIMTYKEYKKLLPW